MKNSEHTMKKMSISPLLLMAGLHFIMMYFLMYAMVAFADHVYLNINNFYMAAIMTSPMLLIEGWLMGSMYENKKVLWMLMGASAMVFVVAFLFIRLQTGVQDREFLRSMIPHHSGAILMCEQAALQDQEIVALCDQIIANQEAEIAQMEAILERMK